MEATNKFSDPVEANSPDGRAVLEISEELRVALRNATKSFSGERMAQLAVAGAASLFAECFMHAVRPEYRLAAFDEYMAAIRGHLERSVKGDRHEG